jgi:hypothetical protein
LGRSADASRRVATGVVRESRRRRKPWNAPETKAGGWTARWTGGPSRAGRLSEQPLRSGSSGRQAGMRWGIRDKGGTSLAGEQTGRKAQAGRTGSEQRPGRDGRRSPEARSSARDVDRRRGESPEAGRKPRWRVVPQGLRGLLRNEAPGTRVPGVFVRLRRHPEWLEAGQVGVPSSLLWRD